jgi:putative transposase
MNTYKHIYCKKVKIIPTKNQKETFDFWLRKCKDLYNTAIQEKIYYYQAKHKYLNIYEQKKELIDIKEFDDSFKDVPNKSLQEIIFRVDKTFKSYFKGNGFPKYKKNIDTIEFVKEDVRLKENKLYLPKIKNSIKATEIIQENWTSVQLKKQYNDYYLIFRYISNQIFSTENNDILGVDLGLKSLYTDSNGNSCKRLSLKLIKKYNKRKDKLNRSLSSKKKGSIEFKKVKKHLNKVYNRLNNTKNDYLHKKSLELLKCKESTINIGDINIQSIIDKNKNKKSKKGLIKSFYTNSLGIFKNIIVYKSIKYNKIVNLVSERNTSKTCSCCGWIKENLKLSDRVFICECGNSIDRDYNSAINMKLLGSSKTLIGLCLV